MKRISALIMAAMLLLCVFAGCGQKDTYSDYVQIDIENYGTIVVGLRADKAPETVKNFLKLVDEGFYDGLTFHRIISGFMMQGGDPEGTGYGGSSQKIKGEFLANGYEKNDLKHLRGVISMARADAFDSATSQFFIVHKDYPSLDDMYAAFGMVVEGMDVVDKVCETAPVDGEGIAIPGYAPVIKSITRVKR